MTLRLHFNENTAGASAAVVNAIRAMDGMAMANYPDYGPVTSRLEAHYGVPAGWVQLTNGLDEGLAIVAQAASRARINGLTVSAAVAEAPAAIVVEPAFEMYAVAAAAAGLPVAHIQPAADLAFPLDAVRSALTSATRLVYLTDPNNPTGLGIPPGAVAAVAAAAPQALVLVDEAYAEFSGRTLIGDLLIRHRNVVIGRTLAKAYGLAGIRAGALVAHVETLESFRPFLSPFSVNACAVVAVDAALSDPEHRDRSVAQSAMSRELIYAFCHARGLEYWQSEANFVLFRVGPRASLITDALAARGILIRDKSRAPGCAGCLRITAGVVAHTERCLTELASVLDSGDTKGD